MSMYTCFYLRIFNIKKCIYLIIWIVNAICFKKMARPGIEPGTACSQSRSHTTRPTGQHLYTVVKFYLYANVYSIFSLFMNKEMEEVWIDHTHTFNSLNLNFKALITRQFCKIHFMYIYLDNINKIFFYCRVFV